MSVIDKPIIFFDGLCNLCNGAVTFFITKDKKMQFFYASLQGETAKKLEIDKQLPEGTDSIVLYKEGKILTHAPAVFQILRKAPWPWKIISAGRFLPKFITNGIYRWIAHNRYGWFGKRESCMMPKPEWKELFLD